MNNDITIGNPEHLSFEEVRRVLLEILRFVHQFCVDNNIRYSLSYGTLLGAVRHGEFIPWDDDIDIMMPRPDFERFCHCFSSPVYSLVSYHNRDGRDVLCRVCDMRSTVVKENVWFCRRKSGVWMDVFVLDSVSADDKVYEKQLLALGRNNPYVHLPFVRHWYARRQAKLMQQNEWGSTGYWSQLSIFRRGQHPARFSDRLLDKYILHDFEGTQFYVLEGYDAFLKSCYGDYMTPPEESKRVTAHFGRLTYLPRPPHPITVFTSGTFDLFHEGHLNILRRSRALGDRLIVMVSSDVVCCSNGKNDVVDNEETRAENVSKSGYADVVLIGRSRNDFYRNIKEYNVDIFVLGSDLTGYANWARPFCQVVYLPRTEGISSSQLKENRRRANNQL